MFKFFAFYIQLRFSFFVNGCKAAINHFKREWRGQNAPVNMEALGFQQVGEGVDTSYPHRNFAYRDFKYTDGENSWNVRLQNHTTNSFHIIADFGMFPNREYMMGDLQEELIKMLVWMKFPPLDTDSRFNKIKNLTA